MKTRLMSTLGLTALLVFSIPATAQQQHDHGADSAQGGGQGGSQGSMAMVGGMMMMQRMEQMHDSLHSGSNAGIGQSTFDSIRAIVKQLQADPATDWSQVDINRFHEHLVDMHHVTIEAHVTSSPVDGGAHYQITGSGRTLEAIQRMIPLHSAEIAMETGWKVDTLDINTGVDLKVTSVDPAETAKIRGLGFMGFMVQGDHHANHHGIIAGAPGPAAADHSTHQH